MSSSKILVAQVGARKHYQEPLLFHQWGVLDTLYTDFYAKDNWIFDILRYKYFDPYLPTYVKRLLDRYEPALVGAKIKHFPILAYNYSNRLKRLKDDGPAATYIDVGRRLCQRIIQEGLGQADTVYGFNGGCLELFEYAKSKGIRCLLDQTLAERSYYYNLIGAEEEAWPNWTKVPLTITPAVQELIEREKQEQNLADQIICGSDFVKSSLVNRGIAEEKITVVSLGRVKKLAAPSYQNHQHHTLAPWKGRPEGLRILFAGSVELRKGIPYFLQALKKLKDKCAFTCKVAGSIKLNIAYLDQYSDVCQFLGRVPRSEMSGLYSWADVFVLPSLYEGSAMVTYEALQYGLPVITTYNAGSIVRDGIGGQIIPMRDPDSITSALLNLYSQGQAPDFLEKLRDLQKSVKEQAINNFQQVVMGK